MKMIYLKDALKRACDEVVLTVRDEDGHLHRVWDDTPASIPVKFYPCEAVGLWEGPHKPTLVVELKEVPHDWVYEWVSY